MTHSATPDTTIAEAFAREFTAADTDGQNALMRAACAALGEGQDAYAVFHALRLSQGWVGTVFSREDIEQAIDGHLDMLDNEGEDAPALGVAAREQVVDAVEGSPTYHRITDRMAERGYEVIADLVADAFGQVTDPTV